MANLPAPLRVGEPNNQNWRAINAILEVVKALQSQVDCLSLELANLKRRPDWSGGGTGDPTGDPPPENWDYLKIGCIIIDGRIGEGVINCTCNAGFKVSSKNFGSLTLGATTGIFQPTAGCDNGQEITKNVLRD